MSPQPTEHLWWLASRAFGVVALLLITASVLVGLAMASGLFRRPGVPRVLSALHEQLAVAGLIAIGAHGVTLLGDPFIDPGPGGIAVPFAIGYRPAFVAAGIIGGYLAAALGLSYYARRRIGGGRWRNAHRYIVVAWMLAVVHTLGAGTDAAIPAVRWAVLAPIVPAAALFAARLAKRRPAARRVRPGVPPTLPTEWRVAAEERGVAPAPRP
jgi:sulfoxide reductase heme-binding subunit YedZ